MTTFDPHSTLAFTNVVSIVSQNDTTLVINATPGTGALFATEQQIIICPRGTPPLISNAMICRLTGISGDQLTMDITSGNREGTAVRTVQPGDQVANGLTPKALTDIEAAVGGGSGGTWHKVHFDYTDLAVANTNIKLPLITLAPGEIITEILVAVPTVFNDGDGDLVYISGIFTADETSLIYTNPGLGSTVAGGEIDVNAFAGQPFNFAYGISLNGNEIFYNTTSFMGGLTYKLDSTHYAYAGSGAYGFSTDVSVDIVIEVNTDPGNDTGYDLNTLIQGAMDVYVKTEQLPS